MNLNKVIIVGRLTQDPEKKVLPDSGMSVTSFSVATNSYYKNKAGERQEKTEFHNLVMFGGIADVAGQYLKKGSIALFEGRLQTRTWDDKDGNKRYRTEIVAEKLQLGPRQEGGFQGKSENSFQNEKTTEREIPVIDEDEEINVEDIPF
jgi:single-strand DNA-binding protein